VARTNDTNPLTETFNVDCVRFPPFGFGRTSCELGIATLSDNVPNFGDRRLCQQIHLAGNYSITSLVFITAGFILTIVLCVTTVVLPGTAYGDAELQRNKRFGDQGTGARSEPVLGSQEG